MKETTERPNNRIFYWLGGFILTGLLVLAGIYYYLRYKADEDKGQHNNYGKIAEVRAIRNAVNDYHQWVDKLPNRRMALDHELTSTGLEKIASVIKLISGRKYGNDQGHFPPAVDTLQVMADSVKMNWRSGRHADMIIKAFVQTKKVFGGLATTQGPAFRQAVEELNTAITNLDPKTLTLNQRDEVKNAFLATARVLESTDLDR